MPILSSLSFGSRGYGFTSGSAVFPAVITTSSSSINEGDSVTFTVETELDTGVILYWTLSGVDHSDINGGVLAGSFVTSGTNGNTSNSIIVTTILDGATDTDSMIFNLRIDSHFGDIVKSSTPVTINNATLPSSGTFSYEYSSANSNGTTAAAPANVYFRRHITQSIYTTSELTANGALSGVTFNNLRYSITGAVPSTNSVRGLNIRLFHTTATNASTVASPISGESKTTVYSVSDTTDVTQFESVGDALFTFASTFTWNGSDNICIETCSAQNEGAFTSAGTQRVFTITNGMRFSRTDNTGTSCIDTPGTISGYKPSVEMDWTGTPQLSDVSATVTPSVSSVNEGGTVTFSVNTTNFTTGTLYWTIIGNVTAADFTAATGSFSVNSSSGGFNITIDSDLNTEGPETFGVLIRTDSISGTIIGSSSGVIINDTSISPTATITPSAANVNEGGTVVFTVNTTNFPSGNLNFDTLLSADMEDSDIDVTSGTVTISGSTGFIAITATADGYTETGQTESFQVRVYHPNGIDILATSSVVTINDTSTGTPEPPDTFSEISNRHIDSNIYMGTTADYDGPYDVGEFSTNFIGTGRVYFGHKVTSSGSVFYSDAPIAGVQILDSSGTTLLASWIFNDITGGSGSAWQTSTTFNIGSSTPGFPLTPSAATALTYSTITTTTGTNQFSWATSTASSNTGAADGIGNAYKLTADGGSNTIAPVGDAQIPQTASTYYAYRETSGSTLWSGAVMRSPTFVFSGGERIRVIHALTGLSSDPQDPNDSLYIAVA